MNLLISDAWAQAAEAAPSAGLLNFLPLIAIFVLFYFLLIRPQQKRAKQHKEMVTALQKGDEVVTNGGVLGRISDIGENFVTLEVGKGVHIKVQRHAIAQMMPKDTVKSA